MTFGIHKINFLEYKKILLLRNIYKISDYIIAMERIFEKKF